MNSYDDPAHGTVIAFGVRHLPRTADSDPRDQVSEALGRNDFHKYINHLRNNGQAETAEMVLKRDGPKYGL